MIIAKLAGLVAGLLRITLLKMKFAVLSLSSCDCVTITLPSLWTAVRVYLSPPYLFFTVHCIVFVIWFLSRQPNKLHHHHHPASDKKQRPEEEGGGPSVEIGTAKKKLQDDRTRVFSQNQLQFSMPLSRTGSESSRVTTTIEGDLVIDSRRKRRASTGNRNPAPPSGKEEEEEETIDATWKYIMAMNTPSRQPKKSETTWRVSPEVETVRSPSVIMKKLTTFSNDPRRGPPVLTTDEEMDAFIKKVKDQFRLQREDSYKRVGGRN